MYAATERGVRALWGSPRFGLAPQKLYLASVAEGDIGTLIDLEHDGDLKMVAAQTDRPIRDTPATPGATCFVTTDSAESLAQHSELALWRTSPVALRSLARRWLALAILVAVIVSASFGLLAVELAAFTGAVLMVLTGVLTPALGRPRPRLERAVRAGRVDRPGRNRGQQRTR